MTKKRAGGVAQGVGTRFKPQYHQKQQQKNPKIYRDRTENDGFQELQGRGKGIFIKGEWSFSLKFLFCKMKRVIRILDQVMVTQKGGHI
jgi:hypothetical protein